MLEEPKSLFKKEDEISFKKQFVINFLAATVARQWDINAAAPGLKKPPVEDAEVLAQAAWDYWVEVQGLQNPPQNPPRIYNL